MAGFAVLRWALRGSPTVRRPDGKADTVAHLVLGCLALYADREGKARPGIPTLAADARLTTKVTADALARLVAAGVLEIAGDLNGTTIWRLRTEVERGSEDAEAAAERKAKILAQQATRARRYRARRLSRHAEVERDVTLSQTVTDASVTPNLSVSHALPERESRSTSAFVTHPTASQPQVSPAVTAIELPLNCHRTTPETPSPGGAPKRTRKAKAKPDADPLDAEANDLARRYYEAMNRMAPFMGVRGVVRHALDQFPRDRVLAGLKHMAENERARPLTRQSLLAAVERTAPGPALRVVGSNGHRPYVNPDPAVYHEDWP